MAFGIVDFLEFSGVLAVILIRLSRWNRLLQSKSEGIGCCSCGLAGSDVMTIGVEGSDVMTMVINSWCNCLGRRQRSCVAIVGAWILLMAGKSASRYSGVSM